MASFIPFSNSKSLNADLVVSIELAWVGTPEDDPPTRLIDTGSPPGFILGCTLTMVNGDRYAIKPEELAYVWVEQLNLNLPPLPVKTHSPSQSVESQAYG